MTPHARERLLAHLIRTGLAGDTRTSRESVVANAERLAAGDPDKRLGLGAGGLDARAVMEAVAALCGCSPDPAERDGPGVIDPELTLNGLEAAAARLARAAAAGEMVLLATGHPSGLLPLYQRIARALTASGAVLVGPAEGVRLADPGTRAPFDSVRYFDGVAVATDGVNLCHTHESWPVERLLSLVGEPPLLVVADHGFAGAAMARGFDVVAFSDVNDPAIAVAWAQGRSGPVIPLDDNRPPREYEPLGELLERAIRAGSGDRAARRHPAGAPTPGRSADTRPSGTATAGV
ncbi:MAG: phosphatase [Acidobacteria bacterium]|nr:phosphatase [Acidobacteriota bacterium]